MKMFALITLALSSLAFAEPKFELNNPVDIHQSKDEIQFVNLSQDKSFEGVEILPFESVIFADHISFEKMSDDFFMPGYEKLAEDSAKFTNAILETKEKKILNRNQRWFSLANTHFKSKYFTKNYLGKMNYLRHQRC